MSLFYRPHRCGLKEAMDKALLFDNLNQMIDYVVEQYNYFATNEIKKEDVSFHLYHDEPDSRIGWKRGYIIMINGYVHGFFTDEYYGDWESMYQDFLKSV